MLSLSAVRIAASGLWRRFRGSIRGAGAGHRKRISDPEGLRQFLESRSNLVAQTVLYGYLRTRAGARFPQLFANDEFSKALEEAKWNVWLACLSDLSVYAGGLLCRRNPANHGLVGAIVGRSVETVLASAGKRAGTGRDFAGLAEAVRARVAACDWAAVEDNDKSFVESPSALIRWAPVLDELKQLDEEIVRNSVRFRWQEVRRDLRGTLDVDALLASAATATAPAG